MKKQSELAQFLAFKAHDGQFRRDGITPYFKHLETAVRFLHETYPDYTDDEEAAIWIHDTIEDKRMNVSDLMFAGINANVIHMVLVMTHADHESYEDYIKRIVRMGLGHLKKADILANLSDAPTDRQKTKYAKALNIIEGGINES